MVSNLKHFLAPQWVSNLQSRKQDWNREVPLPGEGAILKENLHVVETTVCNCTVQSVCAFTSRRR